jgi:hypothetical protein
MHMASLNQHQQLVHRVVLTRVKTVNARFRTSAGVQTLTKSGDVQQEPITLDADTTASAELTGKDTDNADATGDTADLTRSASRASVQITEDNENSAHACKHCQMPFARS